MNGITLPANTNINPLLAVLLKGDYWGDGTEFRYRSVFFSSRSRSGIDAGSAFKFSIVCCCSSLGGC